MAVIRPNAEPAATTVAAGDVFLIDGATGVRALAATAVAMVASQTAGVVTFLATPSSANLKAALTDETGSGAAVFANTPALVTPALGAATATTINGSTVSPGHYSGEPGTGSAAAGEIGEYIESVIVLGSAAALTTATAKTITSISLTAGDWDVDCSLALVLAATTNVTDMRASLSLVTNTEDVTPGRFAHLILAANAPGAVTFTKEIPPYRFSVSGATSIFLIAQANFTVSTLSAYGIIRARRAR